VVITKLQGGLGNQMFQYAAAKSLLHAEEYIYLDHAFLEINHVDTKNFTARVYELHIFRNLKASKAHFWQICLFKSQNIFFKLLRHILKSSIKEYSQIENEYILFADPSQKIRYIYLDGYFQSEKYFKNWQKDIISDFSFPLLDPINEKLKKQIASTTNAVSVHIRRGDYLKSKHVFETHGVLPSTYYNKALNLLKAKYHSLTLFIFSDDIDWAKENLKADHISLVFINNNQSKDNWKDMALMSTCKHHIIANSSFSWWGAWLSKNKGDVCAPRNWFNPVKVNFNIQDFIPDSWIIINND